MLSPHISPCSRKTFFLIKQAYQKAVSSSAQFGEKFRCSKKNHQRELPNTHQPLCAPIKSRNKKKIIKA